MSEILAKKLLKGRKVSKKRRLLTELNGDFAAAKSAFRVRSCASQLSTLAKALQILSENTNLAADVEDLIKEVYPEFYEVDGQQQQIEEE